MIYSGFPKIERHLLRTPRWCRSPLMADVLIATVEALLPPEPEKD